MVEKGIKRIANETDAFLESLGFVHNREKCGYDVRKKNDKRIALFAHEAFGKAFLSCLLDIPYPIISTRMDLGHSSMTVIYFDEQQQFTYPRILQWSNDSHLYKEEILTGYQNRLDV